MQATRWRDVEMKKKNSRWRWRWWWWWPLPSSSARDDGFLGLHRIDIRAMKDALDEADDRKCRAEEPGEREEGSHCADGTRTSRTTTENPRCRVPRGNSSRAKGEQVSSPLV